MYVHKPSPSIIIAIQPQHISDLPPPVPASRRLVFPFETPIDFVTARFAVSAESVVGLSIRMEFRFDILLDLAFRASFQHFSTPSPVFDARRISFRSSSRATGETLYSTTGRRTRCGIPSRNTASSGRSHPTSALRLWLFAAIQDSRTHHSLA